MMLHLAQQAIEQGEGGAAGARAGTATQPLRSRVMCWAASQLVRLCHSLSSPTPACPDRANLPIIHAQSAPAPACAMMLLP